MSRKSASQQQKQDERNRIEIERYQGLIDLARTWAPIDPEYSERIQKTANQLHDKLIIKGVL